jgi:hypothetical protein
MAKGQQRSGREAKKPKQNKTKAAPVASTTQTQIKSGGFTGGKKK